MEGISDINKFVEQHEDEALVLVNQEGLITFVNPAFCTLFKWQKEEIEGQPLTVIIPPALKDAHNIGFSRFLVTEKPTILGKSLDLEAVQKGGCPFKAKHLIVGEKKDGEWTFAAAMVPPDHGRRPL